MGLFEGLCLWRVCVEGGCCCRGSCGGFGLFADYYVGWVVDLIDDMIHCRTRG